MNKTAKPLSRGPPTAFGRCAARQPNGVSLSACKTTTMFTFAAQERTCSVSQSWSITLMCLTLILDTGQYAGSKGASGDVPESLKGTDFMESIRITAPLARHVRVKFYHPRADGSEPNIDYPKVFDILRGVHYHGFVDIVYEPNRFQGDDVKAAVPRIVGFLRSRIAAG